MPKTSYLFFMLVTGAALTAMCFVSDVYARRVVRDFSMDKNNWYTGARHQRLATKLPPIQLGPRITRRPIAPSPLPAQYFHVPGASSNLYEQVSQHMAKPNGYIDLGDH